MSKVLDGAHKGWRIVPRRRFLIFGKNRLMIARLPFSIPLTSKTIKGWQELSVSSDKDAMSMAGRALVGGFLLGSLGLLGGAATAKSKGTAIAIEFKNGKRSLVQLDQDMFAKFQFDLSGMSYDNAPKSMELSAPNPKKRGCLRIGVYIFIGMGVLGMITDALKSPEQKQREQTERAAAAAERAAKEDQERIAVVAEVQQPVVEDKLTDVGSSSQPVGTYTVYDFFKGSTGAGSIKAGDRIVLVGMVATPLNLNMKPDNPANRKIGFLLTDIFGSSGVDVGIEFDPESSYGKTVERIPTLYFEAQSENAALFVDIECTVLAGEYGRVSFKDFQVKNIVKRQF